VAVVFLVHKYYYPGALQTFWLNRSGHESRHSHTWDVLHRQSALHPQFADMHDFALYGQIPGDDYQRMLQQLAGVARMQPQNVREIRMVFRASAPPGLNVLPSAGGTQGVQQQDLQRVKTALNASLYYVQLVGEIAFECGNSADSGNINEDVPMNDGRDSASKQVQKVKWSLEFKDTPEAGKQPVSMRLASRIAVDDGNFIDFMQNFGYE